MKKSFSSLIKISITVLLLIFLFHKVDFKGLFEAIVHSRKEYIFCSFLLFFFLNLLVVARWYLLLKGIGTRVRLPRLFLSYLSSLFFNLILPSTIGGDTVRTLDISDHTRWHSSSILATVLLDRVSGFLGLITVLLFALPFGLGIFNDASIWVATFVLIVVVVFLLGAMFSGRFFNSLCKFLPFKGVRDYLVKIHAVTSSYRKNRSSLWGAWVFSILIHVGLAVVYYLLAQALGLRLGFPPFLIFVPMITVFSSIPFSVGGLGVRDAAAVFVFTRVGVTAEKAFAMSLTNFGFMFILGILGGLSYVFILYRRRI